ENLLAGGVLSQSSPACNLRVLASFVTRSPYHPIGFRKEGICHADYPLGFGRGSVWAFLSGMAGLLKLRSLVLATPPRGLGLLNSTGTFGPFCRTTALLATGPTRTSVKLTCASTQKKAHSVIVARSSVSFPESRNKVNCSAASARPMKNCVCRRRNSAKNCQPSRSTLSVNGFCKALNGKSTGR